MRYIHGIYIFFLHDVDKVMAKKHFRLVTTFGGTRYLWVVPKCLSS